MASKAVTEAVVLLLDKLAPLGDPALLPVGQQPLIEFTLGWLERSGLSEVHLVTCSYADQLSMYLRQAGWASCGGARRGMAVHVIAAPGCSSEGEALRFVEQKDVIKGDFVLVSGGVVSNADLRPALAAHMARRAADRQALLTLLLHSGSSMVQGDRLLAMVDSRSQQLLRLEQQDGGSSGAGIAASLATHLFGERNSIAVYGDLRPSSIYICAPEVLVLLSDNFDYQSLLGDLVPGVLSEQELGSSLFIHKLARGYVEQVSSVAGYAHIVEDVVNRWAYPWTPDNSDDLQDSCRFNRGTYVDASATMAPGSCVSKGSLVGRGSTVETEACLERCIVGTGCHIGRGAMLQGSCLHSHVRVDSNARLSSAVLASHVVVRSHARLETGALLGWQTVIDTAHSVPAGMWISLVQRHAAGAAGSDDEDGWKEDASQLAAVQSAAAALAAGGIPEAPIGFDDQAVGTFGAGFIWGQQADTVQQSNVLPFCGTNLPTGCDSDSEAGDFTKDIQSGEDSSLQEQAEGTDQFKKEVAETFLRCIKEHISHENAVIELNGLKIAEDRTFADCARYIFTTMLSLCLPPSPLVKVEYRSLFSGCPLDLEAKEGQLELLRRINAQLKAWKQLLHRFLKSNDDQVELLLTFEEYCAEEGDFSSAEHGSLFAKVFPQIVKLCYDHDLLSEDAILDWACEKEHASNEDRRFVNLCSDLLAWLEDAEEQSSEEEGED